MGYQGQEILPEPESKPEPIPCRSCKAPILFIKTDRGKLHPVNAVPKRLWVKMDGVYVLRECYESHFATCPEADKFRRKPRGRS